MTNCWVLVSSEEIFATTRQLGYTLAGIKPRFFKKGQLIQPGDPVLYYLTGRMVIGGISHATSTLFEDTTTLTWHCAKDDPSGADGQPMNPYPYRFTTQPVMVPKSLDEALAIATVVPQLEYLKKWPAARWTLGFQGNLHQWGMDDYEVVRKACAQAGYRPLSPQPV
jgi:hypothetical protein